MRQIPFDDTEFVMNPERRCACVLLLDTSYSMEGERIEELNRGLQAFIDDVTRDELAMKRVELTIVTFGSVSILDPIFSPVDDFRGISLETTGNTPMGEAILTAVDLIEARKSHYKRAGVPYHCPWIWLVTDGQPTDDIQEAITRVHTGERRQEFVFFSVAVKDANMDILRLISPSNREPLRLRGLKFQEMFLWLSSSLRSVSRSNPGEGIELKSPAGWAKIET